MGQKGFENRELSWLAFNERVLEKAEEEQVPLCERLFFLSVFESNQDEFFMVRVGALTDLEREDPEMRENKTHRTPREQLEAIAARVRRLEKRRDRCYLELTDQD